MDGEHSG